MTKNNYPFLGVRGALACALLAAVSSALVTRGENPGKRSLQLRQNSGEPGDPQKVPPANPVVQLACDPAVQGELHLKPRQVAAIDALYAKVEGPLWLARDVTAGPAAAQKELLATDFEKELESVFDREQVVRLRQIMLQARGWPALTTTDIADRLQLSAAQARQIDEVVATTLADVQKVAASQEAVSAREQTHVALRKREGNSIQKLLSTAQRQTLAELVGVRYDLSRVRSLTFAAPELAQVDAWHNSKPLRLADLRGKVAAFHFWAFGCINCIHNLPHYNAWHKRLADRGLIVLGMHTPETQAERVPAALGEKVKQFAIAYPVAADHENQNWAAWANSMWPSVYLVDKRGRVRYWWYGEMNWQGTEGEKFMRQKIEELLDEPTEPATTHDRSG